MTYIYIYLFLEVLQLLFFLNKRKNPLVVCNTSFQLVLAIGAFLLVEYNLYEFEVVLYPLLMWVILNFIINFSISGPIRLNVSPVAESRGLKWIFIFYAICSVYFILLKGIDAIGVYTTGNYASMYWEARDEDFQYHSNIFEQIAINYVNYLYVPAALYGFCLITASKRLFGTLYCLLVFLDKLVWSTAYSSRAELFAVIVLFFMLLLTFKKYFDVHTYKKISKVAFIAVGLAGTMIVFISLSRFNGMMLSDWILLYFGRSPLTFLDHVASITRFGDGHVFFSYIKGILPFKTHDPAFLRDTGANFVPEIGRLFDDFGWWFVPFLLLPVCYILRRFMKKKSLSFAEAYVLFNTFMIFFIGNMYKTADVVTLLMIVFLYFMFKMSERKTNNNPRIIKHSL